MTKLKKSLTEERKKIFNLTNNDIELKNSLKDEKEAN